MNIIFLLIIFTIEISNKEKKENSIYMVNINYIQLLKCITYIEKL